MPPSIVPLPPHPDSENITLPERDEFLVRLRKFHDSPYVEERLHPKIAAQLAGKSLMPLGVINGFVIAVEEYVEDCQAGPSSLHVRDTAFMNTPEYFRVMIDDEVVLHDLLCLWLWFALETDRQHGIRNEHRS
jgi:hypothetical protein